MRIISFLSKLGAIAALIVPAFALAQSLNPGKEETVKAGFDSNATIVNAVPGKFTIRQTGIHMVYVGAAAEGIKLVSNQPEPDTSGKGPVWKAKFADNPSLQGKQLCYQGLGGDWSQRFCSPMNGDNADVTISYPAETPRGVTFALTLRLYDGNKPIFGWPSHAVEFRHQFACKGLPEGQTDMGSVFTIDTGTGLARAGTAAEAQAYVVQRYAKFCNIGGRVMTNPNPPQ